MQTTLPLLLVLAFFHYLTSQASTKRDIQLHFSYQPFSQFQGDTLRYLQDNFVEQKQTYVGKQLKVLLADLEFSLHSFQHSYRFTQQGISSSLTLMLAGGGATKSPVPFPIRSPYSLCVRWQKPLTKSELGKHYKSSDTTWNTNWDNLADELETFLSDQFISNVGVIDYYGKDSLQANPFYKPLAEFQGDTLQYLTYNFSTYAEQYEGQAWELFQRDLEVPVKYFEYGFDTNSDPSEGLQLSLYNSNYPYRDGYRYAKFAINLKTPVPREEILKWLKDRNRNWNTNLVAFYRQQIISKVVITVFIMRTFNVFTKEHR